MKTSNMNKPLELDNFSGPLDLLLQLIENREMDITEVSLREVTEQFLMYLEEVEESPAHELADFLVVATKLLLIKSQALLPFLEVEEEQDPDELAAQLKMYKKYAEATVAIEERIAQQLFLYPKKAVKQQQRDVSFHPPEGTTDARLRELFVDVLQRLEPVVRIPKAAMQKVMTLREKFTQIHSLLERSVKLNFEQLLVDAKDPAEVVVTFLAVLEMVKQRSVAVRQDDPFATITIEKMTE